MHVLLRNMDMYKSYQPKYTLLQNKGAVIKKVTEWGGRVHSIFLKKMVPQHKILFWFETPTKKGEKFSYPNKKLKTFNYWDLLWPHKKKQRILQETSKDINLT